MKRRLCLLVPFVASLALAACGSTAPAGGGDAGVARDGGSDGGATPADGGVEADGGARDGGAADGGQRDGGAPDGGAGDGGLQCLPAGCVDATGTFNACVMCPGLGNFGPYNVDITQDVCKFHACTQTSPDAGTQCSDGCIDENGN